MWVRPEMSFFDLKKIIKNVADSQPTATHCNIIMLPESRRRQFLVGGTYIKVMGVISRNFERNPYKVLESHFVGVAQIHF